MFIPVGQSLSSQGRSWQKHAFVRARPLVPLWSVTVPTHNAECCNARGCAFAGTLCIYWPALRDGHLLKGGLGLLFGSALSFGWSLFLRLLLCGLLLCSLGNCLLLLGALLLLLGSFLLFLGLCFLLCLGSLNLPGKKEPMSKAAAYGSLLR